MSKYGIIIYKREYVWILNYMRIKIKSITYLYMHERYGYIWYGLKKGSKKQFLDLIQFMYKSNSWKILPHFYFHIKLTLSVRKLSTNNMNHNKMMAKYESFKLPPIHPVCVAAAFFLLTFISSNFGFQSLYENENGV